MAKSSDKKIRVRQIRSGISTTRQTRETLKALGLRRIHQVVERDDTPETRGMIAKIAYLVEVVD
jgi:large subunit ribosomal protein L30